MPVIRLALGLLIGGLTGCIHAAELRDQFTTSEYTLPFNKRLQIESTAPIIVLGTVVHVSEIGAAQRSPGDLRVFTQLTQITINIEAVIKGAMTAEAIEFYFFTYSPRNEADLGVPRYIPEVGQRRIYFLKYWETTYRSIGDVTNYTLQVASGTHRPGFCQGKDPGCCIADILLIPTEDVDVGWFALELGRSSAYAAGGLCSPVKIVELISTLTRYPNKEIADSAIKTMHMLPQWWP